MSQQIYDLFSKGNEKLIKLLNTSGADVLISNIDCILNVRASYNTELPIHPVEDGNVIGDHATDKPVEIVLTPLFNTDNHFSVDSIFKTLQSSREKLELVSPTINQKNLVIKSYTFDETFIDEKSVAMTVVLQEVKSARVKYSQTQPYPAQGSKSQSADKVKKPMAIAKKPDKIGKITGQATSAATSSENKKQMSAAKKIKNWLGV
ncbi:MAG: hypothetical protein EBX50_01450 [Chitinophagia bacterium]|nr:hypothetical protein [Chitinophagia bacterium]